jgi:Ca2+/Na+ antiporter
MKFFFILGALISASAWLIPQSFIDRHDINRKKVLFFGLNIFTVGALIMVFQSFYFLFLLLLAAFVYLKYIK